MLDLSYFIMIKLYREYKGENDKEIPENWLNIASKEKEEIYDEIIELF